MFRGYIMFVVLVCVQSPSVIVVDSARILAMFPTPSISHQVVFRPLMLELGKRGHEVVIVTPNPALPTDRPPDNITEIDTGQAYQLMDKLYEKAIGNNMFTRGIVIDVNVLFTKESAKGIIELISYQFELTEVKQLLENKSQKFDLVFVEAVANFHLIVSHIFNAPAILFSSFYGCPEHFEIMGAVAWHPIFYPNYYRNKYNNLSLFEKMHEIYLELKLYQMVKSDQEKENQLLKEHFGPEAPTVHELHKNVELLFVNAHPIFGNNRPVPPAVVHLGAMHLQPVKELPQDIKTYLDSSTRGVVYVSLGSNVRPSMMDKDLLDAFLDAFEALPYDILWKFDGDQSLKVSKNVRIQKWFPQRDLLAHPKIKVFVTQGGLQSTDEAIDSEVPLVGIPIMADQWYNVNKYIELGIGVKVDVLTMTADDLVHAVLAVIGNDTYKKNIQHMRVLLNNQPQVALERAVYWTESVLRYGGKHLRGPAANTTWFEYIMLDVLSAVLGIAIVSLALILYVCSRIISICKRAIRAIKLKQS